MDERSVIHQNILKDYQSKHISFMPQEVRPHPTKEGYFQIEQQVNVWAEHKKIVPDISDIKKLDNPVAVLGAGPSLPNDLKKIPKDCILVSANQHALRLVKADYMCFLDPIDQQKGSEFYEAVVNPICARISLTDLIHTDYYCVNEYPKELENPSDTGRFALWVSTYLTNSDIYLCGIGLRSQNEPNHFYDHSNYATWGGPDIPTKIRQWMRFINYVGKERVKVVSGPLKDHIDA